MDYTIKITNWQNDKSALSIIRRSVFIDEQKVPEELEWDEYDNLCVHILISINNTPVACGRIKPDGQIGRMAVLKKFRNTGMGTSILNELISTAKKNQLKEIFLHAQISATHFYEKFGFKACSEIFLDANIPHKTMKKNIS